MPTIGTRTFAFDGPKKYMTLGNEEFRRPLACGRYWSWLRVGIAVDMTPNGTSNITGTRMVICLVSGNEPGRGYNSSNTTQAFGCLINHTDESAGQTLTYFAGSGNPFYRQNTVRGAAFTRIGNTSYKTNYATTGGTVSIPTTGGSVQRRACLFVDFFKPTYQTVDIGTTWYTRQGGPNESTTLAYDLPRDLLQVYQCGASLSGDPFSGNQCVWTSLATTATVPDEATYGYLDTVSIFWNQANYPIGIYDIVVSRIR